MDLARFERTKNRTNNVHDGALDVLNEATQIWLNLYLNKINNLTDKELDDIVDSLISNNPDSNTYWVTQFVARPAINSHRVIITTESWYGESKDLIDFDPYDYSIDHDESFTLFNTNEDVLGKAGYELATDNMIRMDIDEYRNYMDKQIVPAIKARLKKYGLKGLKLNYSIYQITIYFKNPLNRNFIEKLFA